MRKYFLTNCTEVSKLYSFHSHGNILGWIFFSVEEIDFEKLKLYASSKLIEVEKDVAIYGIKSWGDVRDVISVYSIEIDNDNEFEDEIDILSLIPEGTELTPLDKVKIPLSEKRKSVVIKAMKLVAKMLVETEYDRRYQDFISRTSILERESWKYQISDDSFRNSLAVLKGKEQEEFSEVIITQQSSYEAEVKRLYIECQELKQKFYDAETIRELNLLYEDYFNLPMHKQQAIEIGREIVHEDKPNERKSVGIGINF